MNYKQLFFKYYEYTEGDFIPCLVCGKVSVDIHHIEPKGMGGSKSKDRIDNLISLCRQCHLDAHAGKLSKSFLKELLENRLK